MALQTACAESKEERILPLLSTRTRAQHTHSTRIDNVPLMYAEMSGDELDRRIAAAKEKLGERLVILGHHYQRNEIIKYADFRGDSFKLAQLAAARPQADYIVFCGVHFMAESADILSAPHQRVILPNPAAGCSMADMANIAEVDFYVDGNLVGTDVSATNGWTATFNTTAVADGLHSWSVKTVDKAGNSASDDATSGARRRFICRRQFRR